MWTIRIIQSVSGPVVRTEEKKESLANQNSPLSEKILASSPIHTRHIQWTRRTVTLATAGFPVLTRELIPQRVTNLLALQFLFS